MQKHKYLFVEIRGHEEVNQRRFKSRDRALSEAYNRLQKVDDTISDIIYHDQRKHMQELICENGTRFLINRI